MSYKFMPVKIEIIDDCVFLVATVAMVDEGLASVEFHSEVTRCSWPEISSEIQKALNTMLQDCNDDDGA